MENETKMNKIINNIIAVFLVICNLFIVLDFYIGIVSLLNFNILLKTFIIFGITDIISFICICYVISDLVWR